MDNLIPGTATVGACIHTNRAAARMPLLHDIAIPFEAAYADVLAVCCSDGRFIEAVGRFLEDRDVARHDLLAWPGGPGMLCAGTAGVYERKVATDALDFLVESHHTRRLILIGHDHCAYYRRRWNEANSKRPIDDLSRVRAAILSRHTHLAVEMYFARRQEGAAVGFQLEQIGAADG